jgi:hypothetical protein
MINATMGNPVALPGLWKTFCPIVVGLLLYSCASQRYPHSSRPEADALEAAEITIIRTKDSACYLHVGGIFCGRSYRAVVYLDREPLVALRRGHCAVLRVEPGSYRSLRLDDYQELAVRDSEDGPHELELGQHYYLIEVIGQIELGLRRTDEEEAARFSKDCEWISLE